MTRTEKALYRVFGEVRTCFNRLKSLAEQLHSDRGVNPSMRAVMEAVADHGAQTVPDIARQKEVSRQHIQNIMNSLADGGFVELIDNPAHKRSPLYALTTKGEAAFTEIRERETEPLRAIAKAMSPGALDEARKLLGELNRQLKHQIEKGKPNDDA